MDYIDPQFKVAFHGAADPQAVVSGPNVRFTVLTPKLIRLEYSSTNQFEDRPTLTFWHRKLPVPAFDVEKTEETIEIHTEALTLCYRLKAAGFTRSSLSIEVKSTHKTWRPSMVSKGNLGGTKRTLDMADGWQPLDLGLMSRDGWSIIDDSRNPVFKENSWFTTRNLAGREYQDLYFFGYGHEYRTCLQDYCRLTGDVPLIPRWILGNWWSRYYQYSDTALKMLMGQFERQQVPLSVCIVDMDWHIVENSYTSGWTGYTWNEEYFPQPEEFIQWLQQKGLRTALNLHPADGVHPHEDQYIEMAKFMGIDPASEEGVAFDITDPKFAYAYFHLLHHPYEKMGVDFWWMDWQQGTATKTPGLDPLFALNHLHFYDLGKDQNKRPFVFSRWGGYGSHRYPIGFSGDTFVSWESLSFQPYFTATAANVAYGWWSHDIGGHLLGMEDPELYTRWVQYGVFSPILRLHSTNNPAHERTPWGHNQEVFEITRDAMQLRHALIPYIYTMAWRNSQTNIPFILPMYYDYPEREEAYNCFHQYMFGSELLVAPFIFPKDPVLERTRQVVWLPEGEWFNFFSGEYFQGDKWVAEYGKLSDILVFAKAGAIIPLGPKVGWGGLDNPDQLDIFVFPGLDNTFDLYEDDGETQQYLNGASALTSFFQTWEENRLIFILKPVSGDRSVVPAQRTYTYHFRGIIAPEKVRVSLNQKEQSLAQSYDSEKETFVLGPATLTPQDELVIELATDRPTLLSKRDRRAQKCQDIIKAAKMESLSKAQLLGGHNSQWGGLAAPNPLDNLEAVIDNIGVIDKMVMGWKLSPNRLLEMDASIARALIEIITKRELFSNFDKSRDDIQS
jgi:alpha-glucosidase (family GH31 glycosyl hydrolase)